jgi:hypothetical protein
VVVASAGITRDRPLVLMTDEDWEDVMRTNVDGVFHLCRAAVHGIMKRRSGCILTISSVTGVYGNPAQTDYASAKAGIIGFTLSLAKEVGRHRIRANAVAPGLISTDMTGKLTEKHVSQLTDAIALRRFGHPEEAWFARPTWRSPAIASLCSNSTTSLAATATRSVAGAPTSSMPACITWETADLTCASRILGRPLLAEVHEGAVLADVSLLPERAPQWDPLAVSRGLRRHRARGPGPDHPPERRARWWYPVTRARVPGFSRLCLASLPGFYRETRLPPS